MKNTRYNGGFTLIELLIATAIFGMLILTVTGIFLGVVGAQRKTEAVRTLQDSIRFVIEAMARDIRTGFNFNLYSPNELRFTSTIGGAQEVSYRFNSLDKTIEKGVFNAVSSQYDFSPLTSTTLKVDYLNFYASGLAAGDQLQPRLTIALSVKAGEGVNETRINIQTTLSQRELQI